MPETRPDIAVVEATPWSEFLHAVMIRPKRKDGKPAMSKQIGVLGYSPSYLAAQRMAELYNDGAFDA